MPGAFSLVRARWRAILAAGWLLVIGAPVVPVHAATTGATETYIVLYKHGASSASAASLIAGAGGQLVYNYQELGVVIASANTRFARRLSDDQAGTDNSADVIVPATPAPGDDALSSLQWDMIQIHAPEARAINGGSPSVVVGDIDTGLDYTHPDLASNVDFANSAGCLRRA